MPSLVAVITDVPADTPVTSPALLTVAIAGDADVHVTSLPVTTVPPAIVSTLFKRNVSLSTTVGDVGVIAMVATGGGATMMDAFPTLPSIVALMRTVPVATPVTTPPVLTVAVLALLVAHVTFRPLITPPLASSADAESWDVVAISTVALAGVTLTVTTATGSLPPPQATNRTLMPANSTRIDGKRCGTFVRTVCRSVP